MPYLFSFPQTVVRQVIAPRESGTTCHVTAELCKLQCTRELPGGLDKNTDSDTENSCENIICIIMYILQLLTSELLVHPNSY